MDRLKRKLNTSGPESPRSIHGWENYDLDIVKDLQLEEAHQPIRALAEIIYQMLPEGGRVLELGTWRGETTVSYAPIVKELGGEVVLVDWFRGGLDCLAPRPHGLDWKPSDEIMSSLANNIKVIGCEGITTIYKSTTNDAVKLFDDESFDLIFVDADHTYEAVIQDLRNYAPKVKKGGIFCGHDFRHKGVRRAVTEFFSDYSTVHDYYGCRQPLWVAGENHAEIAKLQETYKYGPRDEFWLENAEDIE